MTNNEDIKWLYGKLIGQGYDIGTEEEFTSSLSNGDDRDWYYNKAIKMGLDVGSKDEFDSLFAPQEPTATPDLAAETPETPQAPQAPTAPTAPKVGSLNWYTAETAGDAVKNVANNSALASATKAKNTEATDNLAKVKGTADVAQNTQGLIHTTPIESKALELAQFKAKNKAMFDSMAQRTADMGEYYTKAGADVGKVVETAPQYNAETGEFETQYITPTLNREENKAIADAEAREYKHWTGVQSKYVAPVNMTTSAQLRRVEERIADIDNKMHERAQQLMKEEEENKQSGFLGFLNEATRVRSIARSGMDREAYFNKDSDYQALALARRQLEDQRQQLQNKQGTEKYGERFWGDFGRGLWQSVSDIDTWDFGASVLNDAKTMSLINNKIENNIELTDAEANALEEIAESQAVKRYVGDLGSGYNWGSMTGQSLGFAAQMALTGGFSGAATGIGTKAASAVAKAAAKKIATESGKKIATSIAQKGIIETAKSIGKGGLKKMATEYGLTNATIATTRALGVGADILLVRAPLHTISAQGASLVGETVKSKYGKVVYDDRLGTLRFVNDKSWSEAAWQTAADKVIENASEMIGAHFFGLTDISKAFGARNLTAAILRATRENAGTVLSKTSQLLQRIGVNGYFGEVGEEYTGQLWRTMLNLESAKDDEGNNLIFSGKFNGDIWGGIAMSFGMMSSATLGVGYGIEGVKYGVNTGMRKYWEHQVNKASAQASRAFSAEQWENMRQIIDATDNADMSELAQQTFADNSLSESQKHAALTYMERSMNLRGYNLGRYMQSKNGMLNADAEAVNQSYADGYESNDAQEMADARKAVEVEEAKLRSALSGIDQEGVNAIMADVVADPVTAMQRAEDEALRDAIADYANAKAVYDGMQQRVADDIDTQIAVSDATIDRRTNRNTGKVQSVTLKNDKKVYVVGGTLNATENGSVDFEHSDESIIVMDETGALEYSSPKNVLSIDNEIDPVEEKAISAEAIRQQAQAQAEANMSGKLTFTAGEQVNLKQKDGTFLNGTIVGPYTEDGKVFSGLVEVETQDGIKLPFEAEVLQTWADEARQARIEQFDADRSAEREQTRQAEQTSEVVAEETAVPAEETTTEPQTSALERVPTDEQGNPIYEQVDAETAWDAIVEQTEGDVAMAQTVANDMVKDKEKALKAAQNAKSKGGATIAEKIASEQERKANIQNAEQELAIWQAIASVPEARQQAYDEIVAAEEARRAEENAPIVEAPVVEATEEVAEPIAEEAETTTLPEGEEKESKNSTKSKSRKAPRRAVDAETEILRRLEEEWSDAPKDVKEQIKELANMSVAVTLDDVVYGALEEVKKKNAQYRLLLNDEGVVRGAVNMTGLSAKELQKSLGLNAFASRAKGGVSIEKLAEIIYQTIDKNIIGANQIDDTDLRDMLIEAIRTIGKPSDLSYRRDSSRIEMAERLYNGWKEQEERYTEEQASWDAQQEAFEHAEEEWLKAQVKALEDLPEGGFMYIFADEFIQESKIRDIEHGQVNERSDNGDTILQGAQSDNTGRVEEGSEGRAVSEGIGDALHIPTAETSVGGIEGTPEREVGNEAELTAEELEASDIDEAVKSGALAYINGDTSPANQLAYIIAKDYVRNQSQNRATDSTNANGTQLGGKNDALTGGTSGQSGEQSVELDNTKGGKSVSRGPSSRKNSKNDVPTAIGEEGNSDVGGETSGSDEVSRGSKHTTGSRTSRSNGSDVRGTKGHRGGNSIPRADDKQSGSTADDIINDALSELKDLLKNPLGSSAKGKMLSVDPITLAGLLGYNAIKIMAVTGKLAYGLVLKGAYKFKQWKEGMNDSLVPILSLQTQMSDEQIDAYIDMMWDYSFTVDGETHKISEWASIKSDAELRAMARMSVEEKRKLQKEAEKKEVTVCDLDNIRETLPFLLPQQQEDVLKAETQFFDESHNDEAHAYGKGYMFTNGTGTGKTYTGLGVVKRFLKQGKSRVLIVTVSEQKIKDWISDAKNLGIKATMLEDTKSKGSGVVVTQPANMRQNFALLEDEFDLIVYDESHKLMENQEGTETSTAAVHHMLSNRDPRSVVTRKMQNTPLFVETRRLEAELELIKALAKKTFDKYTKEEIDLYNSLGVAPDYPLSEVIEGKGRKLESYIKEQKRVIDEALNNEAQLKAAEESVSRTKVVFLSATPFNTPASLDYAEGYIFTYPRNENENRDREKLRDEFLANKFPSSYRRDKKGGVGRINQAQITDQDAASREEVEFSDYLQNELNTMSGRMLSLEWDYSREFPKLEFPEAAMFNRAVQELKNGKYRNLQPAFKHLLDDYPRMTALMEAIKTSAAVDRIKEHIALGRKVVVFHRRKSAKEELRPPFEEGIENAMQMQMKQLASSFAIEFAPLFAWEQSLNLDFPHNQLLEAFATQEEKDAYAKAVSEWEKKVMQGDKKAKKPKLRSEVIGIFNGDETASDRNNAVEAFNNDNSKCKIIVVQSESGREGISLHDRTGKHQRVMMSLQLPQSPIGFIQAEGRIFRVGNQSNAVFEYPLLGIDIELSSFAMKINGRSETTENLALGSAGRGFKDSISRAALGTRVIPVSKNQGIGGKVLDNRQLQQADDFDGALKDYAEWQDNAKPEDVNEQAIPNPIGYMMTKWAQSEKGETVLVPNAKDGTVARYVPTSNRMVILEGVLSKFARLAALLGGGGRKLEDKAFEDFNIINKADCVVIDCKHGKQNASATQLELGEAPTYDIAHMVKAIQHVEDSGRVVALIADSEVDKVGEAIAQYRGAIHLSAVVKLGGASFNGKPMSVVILDRMDNQETRKQYGETQITDLSDAKTEDTLFKQLRNVEVPKRVIDNVGRIIKRLKPFEARIVQSGLVAKSKNYRTGKMEPDFSLYRNGLSVLFVEGKFVYRRDLEKRAYYRHFSIDAKQIAENDFEYLTELAKEWVALDSYTKMTEKEASNELVRFLRYDEKRIAACIDMCKILKEIIEVATGKTALQLRNLAEGRVENEVKGDMTVDEFRDVFKSFNNEDAQLNALAEKVFNALEKIPGIRLSVKENGFSGHNVMAHYAPSKNAIELNSRNFNSARIPDSEKASTIVHEMIHAVTCYALEDYRQTGGVSLTDTQVQACKDILEVYEAIKDDREFVSNIRLNSKLEQNGEYGLNSAEEMIAELANPAFRYALKLRKLWRQLINGIAKLLSINVTGEANTDTDALVVLENALESLLNDFNADVYKRYVSNGNSFSKRFENQTRSSATDIAIGMLKDAGIEVVEATDAMAEAVLAKGGVMMSMDSAPFYSNAKKAVLDIKQDKATPQQWVAMLKKNGGLKAGEDAWLGLESWLSGQTGSVTKQEIIDYIDEHAIEIEEVNYGESEVSQFEDSDIYNEWAELGGDEDAFNEMIERYGDDFEMAFLYDEGQLYIADEDAASFFIDKGAETINETRLSYTTEGLTDNREIALTVPTIEPYNQNDDIHFGDAGDGRAIAWIRFGETKITKRIPDETAMLGYRVAPVRVLVIDEIQSVRHQDGREKGYRNEEVIALENRINNLHEKMYGEGLAPEEYRELTRLREEQREIIINANPELKAESEKVKELEKEYEALKKDNQSKLDSEGVELARLQTLQEDARSIAEYDRIEKEIQDIKDAADKRKAELNEFFNVTIGNAYDKLHKGIRNDLSNQVYGVPAAPFEKNWHELAMKRMLRYAAENGYDKVAWTTGAQQAARYDMRQQVDNIQVEENNIEEFNDGTPIAKNITINTPRGNKIRYQADAEGNIRGGEYGGKNLKDVVGKELAEKIMQPGSFTIEEEGLAIGGEGMKGFYDKMLPSFVNKYAKKWGAKVGEVTMPSLEEGYQTMHSVDVTPQMKEDVMKGQPMFLRTPNGTVYGWTQGGKVFLTKEGMNAETPIHEYTHLWDKMVQQKNPELWNRGKELLKQTPTWNEVINNANYANIAHDEDAVASEVHSRLSGENGAKVLEQMIKDARKDGAMAVAKAASITERIKEWIKDMFAALKETLSAWSKQDLADLSIEDFNNLTLRDLAEGVNPTEFVTEEGDVQFRAKRKSRALEIDESNLRQTKQETNSIIDKAVGIFVGGPKAAKAMRKQKEAERKALATEIYSKVLAGDFNPLTLQQIEKYINDVTPRNPFGNRISQRIPQEVERGVYGGKTANAIDLLFSRISESAVSASRRSSEDGRREIEERKKEALKGWAIATGNWHTDLSEFTNDKEPFAQGTDSKVYSSKDAGYIIKASKGKPYGKRFRADIDNVALFNHIFPNSKYDIVGYGEIDGNFVRILRQPAVYFSEDAYLTEEERVAYMAELGFKPLNKENTAFSNGDFVVADLQKANIVRDASGNISVIDADVKLHTTDTGGNYSYAPVEEDVLDDDVLYRSDDEMPNFKAKYGLSGVGPTAVIQNENDLIQLKKVVDVNTHQVLEDDFKAPRVYGSAYGNHNFIVIFLNKTTAPSYTSIWWHEAAHIAYRKLNLSNKEELGLHALEWMKRQGGKFRDHYDTIINIYDKSSWATEATARMIQCVVEDNGVEKFLNADFGGNEKLSNLAKAIKNVIIYGKEEPTERDILRHAEYNNRIHTTDSGRVGDGDRVSGGLSSAQHRSNQGRSREDSEGDSGNVREIAERSGEGAVSDEGVTMASDPVSKAIGEPRYGRGKKMREYAERQRRLMAQKVQEIAQKLKLDNVEIVTDASTLSGKRAKAKGYFNPTTGKIVIVIPNHASVLDVEETVLHEAVAHYGLRKLFGKHFDTFLDNVYESADPEIRKKIAALAAKNGWDFRKATEEYLAMLAEDTEFESVTYTGWWFKVKELFRKMLDKLGLEGFAKEGLTLSDNELRYILFRSYQHLQGHRGLMFEAEDAVKQYELGVGNYSAPKVAESGEEGDYYRDGDFTPRDRVMARDHYERVVSSGSYQFREAVQDSMLGLRRLMESILPKTKIEEIAGSENAYIFENRMSSTNAGEQHVYFTRYMKPLLEEIGRICRASKVKREALTEYLMAKHGLERNEYMRKKAEEKEEDTERDFAGLTGLTGEADWQRAEEVARQIVEDFEVAHNTDSLWEAINNATKATLEKLYMSGILSKEQYEEVSNMYSYYIPLRGWDETTSDEVYGYLTSKDGPLGSVMKKAKGRSTVADDPIATIALMADDAIRQGNRNLMKVRFLNFVLNHPSDLVSVKPLWLQYNEAKDEWEPIYPELTSDMTPEEVELEVEAFEERMKQLSEEAPDKYKHGRDAVNIPYKVVNDHLSEHQVIVKRNGRTFILTINGNPRAAQAINGLTNPDVQGGGLADKLAKWGTTLIRELSALYTTRNPDFVISNFMRDMIYTNSMVWAKESPEYALHFHANCVRVNATRMAKLFAKWELGTLGNSGIEGLFYQFMTNGGETGYTEIKNLERHKKDIAAEIKKQRNVGRKVWSLLGTTFEIFNRSVENMARFSAFVTSIEMGRSVDRAIYDAKEISVNFNKKGAGSKMYDSNGQTLLGKIGSMTGGLGRIWYVFFNAGVQGMANLGRTYKKHPIKMTAGTMAMVALGYVVPMLIDAEDDDDSKDAYYNLPEYIRRTNICVPVGDSWITIPLPIDYRALYGLGEMAYGVSSGKEHYNNEELAYNIAAQFSQVLPIDMLEGNRGVRNLIPSYVQPIYDVNINESWTGVPISKQTPFNEFKPEWQKAYQSTDVYLVDATRWLNEVSGGNAHKKGAIDINPADIEYLLSSYLGGVYTFPSKILKTGETAFGDREFEWRNIPLANRLVKQGDERTAQRKLKNQYFNYGKEDFEVMSNEVRGFTKDAARGDSAAAEHLKQLSETPEYKRWLIYKAYKPHMTELNKLIKETPMSDDSVKMYENLYYEKMREVVNGLNDPEAFMENLKEREEE